MFPTLTHESFTALLALVGIVIILSSLMSGAVERTGLPQVSIFLLLGAALGPRGSAWSTSPSNRPRSRRDRNFLLLRHSRTSAVCAPRIRLTRPSRYPQVAGSCGSRTVAMSFRVA
jgi:hypothetical protein